MSSNPRGIRKLCDSGPAVSFCDSANRGRADTEFLGEPALSSARSFGYRSTDYCHLFSSEFCGAASLAILHCAVSSHIKLVPLMRIPTKIADMVVSWIAVVMANVSLLWERVRKEGHSDKPVCESAVRSWIVRLAKHVGPVAARILMAGHDNWRVSSARSRVAPFSGFLFPTSQKPVIGDFVVREFCDQSPFAIEVFHD